MRQTARLGRFYGNAPESPEDAFDEPQHSPLAVSESWTVYRDRARDLQRRHWTSMPLGERPSLFALCADWTMAGEAAGRGARHVMRDLGRLFDLAKALAHACEPHTVDASWCDITPASEPEAHAWRWRVAADPEGVARALEALTLPNSLWWRRVF